MVALGFASMGAVLRIVISHFAITVAKLGARAMHALKRASHRRSPVALSPT
jgi:hypothetical protein